MTICKGAMRVECCQRLTVVLAAALASTSVGAGTYTVNNTNNAGAGSLRQAILDANASGATAGIVAGSNAINITAGGTILLGRALPLIFSNLTINGNGVTIDGSGAYRCLFASGLPTTPTGEPLPITVTLNQLHLNHCVAKGGKGGTAGFAGGGGLGAGGALFVGSNASVTLDAVSFDGNQAIGGDGGDSSNVLAGFGGGGGLGGDGGDAVTANSYGGGGGMGADSTGGSAYSIKVAGGGGGGIDGPGGNVDIDHFGSGGGGGFGGTGLGQIAASQGFASAGSGDQGGAGGTNGGGGGGGGGTSSGDSGQGTGAGGAGGDLVAAGGGGGSGGVAGSDTSAGNGGIGGGGGGGVTGALAGPGGFGGGGGGGGLHGNGGFGGGSGPFAVAGFGGGAGAGGTAGFGAGAGGSDNTASVAGFGGGHGGTNPDNGAGGGGAAMGAAIFVARGGHLTIGGTGTCSSSAALAGNGGTLYDSGGAGGPGSMFGSAVFLDGDGALNFDLGGGNYTINDDMVDASGSGATGNDAGSWSINVHNGTLLLAGHSGFTGPISLSGGATLQLNDGLQGNGVVIEAGSTLTGTARSYGDVSNSGVFAPLALQGQPRPSTLLHSYSQSASGTLVIGVGGPADYPQLGVTGNASIAGVLRFNFAASPAPGTSYTILDVEGSLQGSFSGYTSNMPSVYGEVVYVSNALDKPNVPNSVQFTVIANDLIFRSGFEAIGVVDSGSCRYGAISTQQFAAIPGATFDGVAVCIPPTSASASVNFGFPLGSLSGTIDVCKTSMCSAGVAGCPTTLHAQTATLGGTLASGMYTIDTPNTADAFSAPASFAVSGAGTVASCTASVSAIGSHLTSSYLVEPDSLNGAYVDELSTFQVTSLTANISGCDPYGVLLPYLQPLIAQQTQIALTEYIASVLPRPGAPGEGETICPAP